MLMPFLKVVIMELLLELVKLIASVISSQSLLGSPKFAFSLRFSVLPIVYAVSSKIPPV